MEQIALLSPQPELTSSTLQQLTAVLPDFQISPADSTLSQTKTAILLINAAEGPMPGNVEHLIEMRKNNTQNVFGLVANCGAIDEPELIELVKLETADLLKKYGYFGAGFSVFSDNEGLEKFAAFVKEHLDDTNQAHFDMPTFPCRFCGHIEYKKFNQCPACQKKQQTSFWGKIFGSDNN